ncbi:hypothetical protein ACMFMG_001100 [Clarireedia jacksonii]
MTSATLAITRTYTNTCPPTERVLKLRGSSASFREGALTITPVLNEDSSSSFGAEVAGVDWSGSVPQEVIRQLIELSNKYAVLVFRRTGLDNERHIAFSKQLGEKLEVNPFFYGRENDRVGEPFLWDVGNIELDGSLVKPNSRRWHHSLGNALWHTDSSYHQQRSKYSILLSHGSPVRGGSWTHFADTRRAYEGLPQATKDDLEDMIVEHEFVPVLNSSKTR